MNDFDQAARHAVKNDPAGHLRWLFPRLLPRMRYRRWLDSQSAPRPGEPDRRCDTIAELTDDEGTSPPWAVVIELFTGPDADALDRLQEYLGRFRRELRHGPYGRDRYLFAGALVFLTGGSTETSLDMVLPGQDDVFLKFGPGVMVLAGQDGVAHLDAIEQNQQARSLLAWAPLMKHGNKPDVIARWRTQAEREPDEQLRRTMADIAMAFSDLTDCRDAWRKGLEGFNVNESSYLREVRTGARIETRREDLLRVLQARFPGEIPPPVPERIQGQADPAVLSRWFDLALTAPSLDAFQAGLGG